MFYLSPHSVIPSKCTTSNFNLAAIIRRPYWVIPCYLVKIIICIMLSSCIASLNIQAYIIDGTYIAMYFGNDYVVIGGDSRGTHLEQDSSEDDICKIVPLSKTVIFFGLGITVGPEFNARDIARNAERTVGDDTDLEKIGEQWGAHMVRALEIISGNHAAALVERNKKWGDVGAGIFVAMIGGHLSMYRVAIKMSDQIAAPMKFINSGAPIAQPDKRIAYFGNQATSHAFIENHAPRTYEANEAGAYIAELVSFVEKKSGDPEVGGPVTIMILDSNSGAHWFRRPDFCPEK